MDFYNIDWVAWVIMFIWMFEHYIHTGKTTDYDYKESENWI